MSAYRLTKEWQAVDERSGVLQNTGEQNMEYLILNEEPSLSYANSGKVLNPQNKIFFELQEGYNLYIRAFNVFDGGFIPTASVESIVDFFHREDNPLEGTTNSLTIGVSVWNPKTSYYPEDWVVIAKNLMWKCSVAHDNDSDFDADVARGYWQNIITAINSIEIDGTNIVLKNTKDEETEIPITALSAVQDADGNVITDTYATKTELSDEVNTLNNTISNVEDGLVRSVTKKDDTTITITKGDDTTTNDIQIGTQTYATKTELSDAVDDVEDDIDAVDDTYSFLIRKPSTPYTYGTKVFLPSLNVSMCLQCTVAGTTSNTSLVISNPTVDDTVTDGTCEWTIKEVGSGSGGDGVPIGAIIAYAGNGELPSGYLLCDGSAISRTMFPDLFTAIGTTYGNGDGSTTFNLPDSNQAKRFLQGDTVAGIEKEAGLPNLRGVLSASTSGGAQGFFQSSNGIFTLSGPVANVSTSGGGTNRYTTLGFDASIASSIYSDSVTTVQPPALTTRYIIKAFDGQTADSALIDITQYAQELAHKANINGSNMVHHKDVITTSGTYTAPATGLYKITAKGGGGGGGGGNAISGSYYGGGGGGEGGTTIAYLSMTAGDSATVTIGAGGSGGAVGYVGGGGGNTTVTIDGNTYTANGGGGGFTIRGGGVGGSGTINGCAGTAGDVATVANGNGGSGGGAGGGSYNHATGTQGGGGAGGYPTPVYSGAGGNGFVWFEYFATA